MGWLSGSSSRWCALTEVACKIMRVSEGFTSNTRRMYLDKSGFYLKVLPAGGANARKKRRKIQFEDACSYSSSPAGRAQPNQLARQASRTQPCASLPPKACCVLWSMEVSWGAGGIKGGSSVTLSLRSRCHCASQPKPLCLSLCVTAAAVWRRRLATPERTLHY